MTDCKHYEVCGLEALSNEEALCILHSANSNKNRGTFNNAFNVHRQRKEHPYDFRCMVFPEEIDFSGMTFTNPVDFWGTTFTKGGDFRGATFMERVSFNDAIFNGIGNFLETQFHGVAKFRGATFKSEAFFPRACFTQEAIFTGATFGKNPNFRGSTFHDKAVFNFAVFLDDPGDFANVTFGDEADFDDVSFNNGCLFDSSLFTKKASFVGTNFAEICEFIDTRFLQGVSFRWTRFSGSSFFVSRNTSSMFAEGTVFELAQVASDGMIRFVEVDLTRCRFVGADVRKHQFIGVRWVRIGSRDAVFDEVAPLESGNQRPWAQIEELYRQLKQNYEDRRDHERAGHFHVGEKEMRLRNPATRLDLRILLAVYKGISGYGENYGRPLFWLLVLLLLTSATALVHGLSMETENQVMLLSRKSWSHWGWALLYGFEILVHLPAREFTASGFGRVVSSLAGVFGPVLIALFGFALRQRLKR